MTLVDELGYVFIAFGPAFAMFFVTIARQPHEVIIMILGGFFWILSLFFASVVRVMVPPLRDQPAWSVPFAVIFQELFRYVYYRLLKKADYMLELISEDTTDLRAHKLAYVGGLGFGVASGAIMFSNVLKSSAGPGTVGIFGDSTFFILESAFATSIFILLHTCWGILFFDGIKQRDYFKIIVTLLTHMIASCVTLFNQSFPTFYSLVTCAIILLLLVVYSLHTVGTKFRKLHYILLPYMPSQ